MKKFELADSQGNMHKYDLPLHLADEGGEIAIPLSGMVMKSVLGTMLKSGGDVANDMSPEMMSDMVSELGVLFMQPEMFPLLRKIVAKAVRDGMPLSDKMNFDKAFSGNYSELIELAMTSVQENGFLSPLSALMKSMGKVTKSL